MEVNFSLLFRMQDFMVYRIALLSRPVLCLLP
jgi:hypothetical protein